MLCPRKRGANCHAGSGEFGTAPEEDHITDIDAGRIHEPETTDEAVNRSQEQQPEEEKSSSLRLKRLIGVKIHASVVQSKSERVEGLSK